MKQKLLGLILIVSGILAMVLVKEDATAGVFIAVLGLLRLLFDDDREVERR